jgi:hypothetical protein
MLVGRPGGKQIIKEAGREAHKGTNKRKGKQAGAKRKAQTKDSHIEEEDGMDMH